MRIFLIVSCALLIVGLLVLQQSVGIAPGTALNAILGWPIEQQLALVIVTLAILGILLTAIWQSGQLSQQIKAVAVLQNRVNGVRDQVSAVGGQQDSADAAVRHLVGTDPIATIDDIQQRLMLSETRTGEQAAQNEAVDLQARIDEIRRRQQMLRSQLGTVSEKRRVIEPMLNEVKERQALIERSLGELEKDENGRTLDQRLAETEGFLNRGNTRLDNVEAIFGKFEQMRDSLRQLQSEAVPLRGSETGIKALIGQVVALQQEVDEALLSLEKDESGTINDRLNRLSKEKSELEKRMTALTESFGSLEAIRRDVGEHFKRLNVALHGHLNR